jgi:hypothetical protein
MMASEASFHKRIESIATWALGYHWIRKGREKGKGEGRKRKEGTEGRRKVRNTHRRIRNSVHAVFFFLEQDRLVIFVVDGPHLHEHSTLAKNIVHVIPIF